MSKSKTEKSSIKNLKGGKWRGGGIGLRLLDIWMKKSITIFKSRRNHTSVITVSRKYF